MINSNIKYIYDKIKESSLESKPLMPLTEDILFSFRNNPKRFNDYKQLIELFIDNPIVLQTYLIEPKFYLGETEEDKIIVQSKIYEMYVKKYNKEPKFETFAKRKGYKYRVVKPLKIINLPESFIIPLNELVEIILSSSTLNDMYNKIDDRINGVNEAEENSSENKLLIFDDTTNKLIIKILKSYKKNWCLLVEYVINNVKLLSKNPTIPKTLRYKNENIGQIFNNLCKDLSDNSPYKSFKYDFIDLLDSLDLTFKDLNQDDMISATPFRKKNKQ